MSFSFRCRDCGFVTERRSSFTRHANKCTAAAVVREVDFTPPAPMVLADFDDHDAELNDESADDSGDDAVMGLSMDDHTPISNYVPPMNDIDAAVMRVGAEFNLSNNATSAIAR